MKGTFTMKRTNNYLIMRDQAKTYFLNFDQQVLAARWKLPTDDQSLYVTFFGQDYRIDRKSGFGFRPHCGDILRSRSSGKLKRPRLRPGTGSLSFVEKEPLAPFGKPRLPARGFRNAPGVSGRGFQMLSRYSFSLTAPERTLFA